MEQQICISIIIICVDVDVQAEEMDRDKLIVRPLIAHGSRHRKRSPVSYRLIIPFIMRPAQVISGAGKPRRYLLPVLSASANRDAKKRNINWIGRRGGSSFFPKRARILRAHLKHESRAEVFSVDERYRSGSSSKEATWFARLVFVGQATFSCT